METKNKQNKQNKTWEDRLSERDVASTGSETLIYLDGELADVNALKDFIREELKAERKKLDLAHFNNGFKKMSSQDKVILAGEFIGMHASSICNDINANEFDLKIDGKLGTVKIHFKQKSK